MFFSSTSLLFKIKILFTEIDALLITCINKNKESFQYILNEYKEYFNLILAFENSFPRFWNESFQKKDKTILYKKLKSLKKALIYNLNIICK